MLAICSHVVFLRPTVFLQAVIPPDGVASNRSFENMSDHSWMLPPPSFVRHRDVHCRPQRVARGRGSRGRGIRRARLFVLISNIHKAFGRYALHACAL